MSETLVPFVDLGRQHSEVEDGLLSAFHRVVDQGNFTLGEEVEAFEREFAAFVGTAEAVGVASGTDALHFALRAVGVGAGDEVITAVNTFAATAEAILMCGATPVFVDIDERTYLMDLDAAEAAVTPRTKAIVPVHLYGQAVDMKRVQRIADRHGLAVIEDACQAHGARTNGLTAGAAGTAGCFSFYPGKNLGALGDGGMVTTNDHDLAERVRLLRCHGEDAERNHIEPGYCSRLHGIQAAFLRAKLPRLSAWNDSRRETARSYGDALADSALTLPVAMPGSDHVYHLYVARVENRDVFRSYLADRGIQTGVHYPTPLHLEPAFASDRFPAGSFPVAERTSSQIVSLPMFPYMTEAEIRRVAGTAAQAVRLTEERAVAVGA